MYFETGQTHIRDIKLQIRSNNRQNQRRENESPVRAPFLHRREQNHRAKICQGPDPGQDFVVDAMENEARDDVDEDAADGLGEEVDCDFDGGELQDVLHVEGKPEGGGGEGHEA
jgi:hypothetical protein